ncbi:Serine 3-dehydrogenase [Vibrio aerogenes CECT 7868]|uniref:Serine 3-dehydrogenase n=1 Tax=Vibrio aerogenes CECT 7868 TaxID=1216006 RepID=A0A1M5VKE5_9VIBR|nr:SDR family NAD(P)-dependent oxidoreductase [Vibrio aerogenes]SHH75746.1 Serine 3-dehydrogenase [Vibrio aerogenes CECT 7868]
MRTVLITGATSGIGQQLATDYAKEGWLVVACGRNASRLEALKASHPGISTLCFDVTQYEAVAAAFATLSNVPDLWIFSAGDCEYIDNGRIDSELCQRVMAVNFFGVVHCLQAAQDYLKSGNHVAVISSVASVVPLPRSEAYGASKAALDYFLSALRLDWHEKHIDLSLISPGFVDTPLTQKNTFAMPMCISVQAASKAIQVALAKRKSRIFFPRLFTGMLRFIGLLPHDTQQWIVRRLTRT